MVRRMSSVQTVLAALLEAGEEPRFETRPPEVLLEGRKLNMPVLLLTDRRLIVARERPFGKPRLEFEVAWEAVGDVEGQLASSGMRIELVLPTSKGTLMIRTFTKDGSDVEAAIRNGYLHLR